MAPSQKSRAASYLNPLASVVPVLLLLSACAAGGSSSQLAEEIPVQDTTISTEIGDVSFRNVRVEIDNYSSINEQDKTLKGKIINKTRSKNATFKVKLSAYSRGGILKDDVTIEVPSIERVGKIFNPVTDFSNNTLLERGDKANIVITGGSYQVYYSFTMVEPYPSKSAMFENDSLSIDFSLSKEGISFFMSNKTEEQIQILWNQTSYIDIYGSSNRVLPSGVRYINKNESLQPTNIPPRSNTEKSLIPSDNVTYVGDEWVESSLFPNRRTFGNYEDESDTKDVESYTGEKFGLFLPVMIGDEKKEYRFVFKIEDDFINTSE